MREFYGNLLKNSKKEYENLIKIQKIYDVRV